MDFETGNVDFEGNIMISGGVKPGFKLRASGTVQIGGAIEGAIVEAGSDITVAGGIVGRGEAVVRSGGAITARFVEQAELHAAGPIKVGSEIRLSTAISEKSIIVSGQGRIVGGTVRARDLVEAKVLGSPAATPTSVQVGYGEEMEVEIGQQHTHTCRISVSGEVNGGVTMVVWGAAERFSRVHPGGVWREKDGKVEYSAR